MATREDKPASPGGSDGWRNKKSRDDTPSFIRDVQARAEMLNPNRSSDAIPVLAMPKSVRLWRKIRWPLFIALVVLFVLGTIIFVLKLVEDRGVKSEIADAAEQESDATIEGLLAAEASLQALADRHPGRTNAQAAYAWHAVLLGELFGPAKDRLDAAAQSLSRIAGDPNPLARAALAGAAHLAGREEEALAAADAALQATPEVPQLRLARAWALRALGKKAEAHAALAALREDAPRYLPAVQFSLLYALEDGDLALAKEQESTLLALSPGDLLGTLGSIAVRLPGWNQAADPEAVAEPAKEMKTLRDNGLEKAPANVGALGLALSGRINLATGALDAAIADLRASLERRKSDEVLAWYALAVRRKEGPQAALALIGSSGRAASPALAGVAARCHLDLHHVEAAAAVVAAAGGGSGPDFAEISWILAVQRGDAAAAVAALPEAIDSRLQWIGLEMYDLLRYRGDAAGIAALAERFQDAACGDAIRAWHANDIGRLYSVFEPEEAPASPCVAALTARLMRGHLAPDAVKKAADAAVSASGGDLLVRVSAALANRLVDGRAAAEKALDEIAAVQPEGTPIRIALGEAYLELGLPARAAESLASCASGECAAARIAALRAAEGPAKADAELAAALAAGADPATPGLACAAMERDLAAGKLDAVIAAADAALPTAGRWTAEIAELKARALSATGDRGNADRTLLSAADKAVRGAGLGEAWQAKLVLVRMNLARGGAFLFKAFAVTFELYKAGVKDAELSFSYAVANIEQGNERGAVRYLVEAIALDPSFVPAYTRLKQVEKLTDDLVAGLARIAPGAQP